MCPAARASIYHKFGHLYPLGDKANNEELIQFIVYIDINNLAEVVLEQSGGMEDSSEITGNPGLRRNPTFVGAFFLH